MLPQVWDIKILINFIKALGNLKNMNDLSKNGSWFVDVALMTSRHMVNQIPCKFYGLYSYAAAIDIVIALRSDCVRKSIEEKGSNRCQFPLLQAFLRESS